MGINESRALSASRGIKKNECQNPPTLQQGFQCETVARDLRDPRFILFLNDGCGSQTLLVAERGRGRIVAVSDVGEVKPLVTGLHDPTSLAVSDGKLYIGEASEVSRFDLKCCANGVCLSNGVVLVDGLPTSGNHTTRTVLIHNNHIYVSVGSTCNSCVEEDPRRAVVLQFDLDGQNETIFSSGLRNSVGLAVNPWTGQLWATTNARDWLGDDQPPDTIDELHSATFYGWPFCHAGRIPDPQLASPQSCQDVPKPVVDIQAHSAPLGLAFYDPRNPLSPPGFARGLYVALHGSWNRTVPTGHSILFVPMDEEGRVSGASTTFAQWSERVRPVGLAFGPRGLYVSDDRQGDIYLLSRA